MSSSRNALRLLLLLTALPSSRLFAAPVPTPVWSLDKAYREASSSRERVSINGLWRWQPSKDESDKPGADWGYFKVPGPWPGIQNWMQKDCQTLYSNPAWKDLKLDELRSAWMEREVEIPAEWAGRQILLTLEYLNSFAVVQVDGKKAGELRFPGGSLDLGSFCKPGKKYRLTLLVTAMPLEAVKMSYADSARAKQVKGEVERRGLCGDAWLEGWPRGPRIADLRVETSFRKGEIIFDAALENLEPGRSYSLKADLSAKGQAVQSFRGPALSAAELKGGRASFSAAWKPERLWDTVSPENQYDVTLSLAEGAKTLDQALPQKVGFRELWIQGKDFYLNGTRIYFSILPMDNAAVGAAWASYEGSLETFKRLKAKGFNAVYSHNYGCEPGTHLSYTEVLRAADDAGMLVFFAMPHFGQYEWEGPDADKTNGYAQDAAWYVRAAQNHPSVLMYAMSHNGAGYAEDMNPDQVLGEEVDRDNWSGGNARKALRCEAIVRALDPSRIVYHHSAGNLGSMHTVNFYANMTPVQEMNDWFIPFSEKGKKPLILIEYGVPISWDWTLYRGWYKGEREFGSAAAPWEWCQAEWNASFLGDRSFKIQDEEKANLRWEAPMFEGGGGWHRWDYPRFVGWDGFDDQQEVYARYLTQNLRAFRSLGVSGFCVWDHPSYWRIRPGTDKNRKELATDWEHSQKPGFSPDYMDERFESFEKAYAPEDWLPTAAGRALERNNAPLLGYIAGKAGALTSQDHIYAPGENLDKQLLIINNSRLSAAVSVFWSLDLPKAVSGQAAITVATGDQARLPLRLSLPKDLASGDYALEAQFSFGGGLLQKDLIAIRVLAPAPAPQSPGTLWIFDPKGETTKTLAGLGVVGSPLGKDLKAPSSGVLVLGRGALSVEGPGPDLSGVQEGLRVLVFEQSSEALEKRLGFRVAEHGLREVFRRVPDHPLLAGLDEESLRDWRGEATLLPPRLNYVIGEKYSAAVTWAGMEVTRSWRAGNRGNVASVLIEKPARGDFLPVLDGGFSLQYSPLLEYWEGSGMILFCQMDVTGRTEDEPAAKRLVRNLLNYVTGWKGAPARPGSVVFAGQEEGRRFLESEGLKVEEYPGKNTKSPAGNKLLVLGRGYSARVDTAEVLSGKTPVLALGLDGRELEGLLAGGSSEEAEHIATYFEPPALGSPFEGLGPADVHNRSPRKFALVKTGALGDGILARAGNVIFDQILPWNFDYSKNYGVKRTFRRAAFTLNRILSNLGARGSTPVLTRFATPPTAGEKRYLEGLYMDQPEEWDDPYRFFRW